MKAMVQPQLLLILAGIYGALLVGSVIRFCALRKAPADIREKRLQSLGTWWGLTVMVTLALLFGRVGICLIMGFASVMAYREYVGLLVPTEKDRRANWAVYALIFLNYGLLLLNRGREFAWSMPLLLLLLPAVVQLVQGRTGGYVRSTAGQYWGSMLLVFALSHTVLIYNEAETVGGPAGGAGWLLYLLILTEVNDIAQALVGRRFGQEKKHRITPHVSPNKTWEGFIGGLTTTLVLAVLLAPWTTSLLYRPLAVGAVLAPAWMKPVLAGGAIAVLGFLGDINMSAIKRDVGVKDSGSLLPGMGGVIDRVDSLTFTAPFFAYFMQLVAT